MVDPAPHHRGDSGPYRAYAYRAGRLVHSELGCDRPFPLKACPRPSGRAYCKQSCSTGQFSGHVETQEYHRAHRFNPNGKCVYSAVMELSDYYDGKHVWDTGASVRRLRFQRIMGYLFDAKGNLEQEFERVFDLKTGVYKSGHARFADGTVRVDE
jgi:hypothetical protein